MPEAPEAVIRDDPEALVMFREAMKHQGERTDFVDNVNEVERPAGNSRAYSIARVQRECDAETVAARATHSNPVRDHGTGFEAAPFSAPIA